VTAAYKGTATGVVGSWVNPIREIYLKNRREIDNLPTELERTNRLSELNVIQQVRNICVTSVMQRAIQAGDAPTVHGWVLDIANERIKEMDLPFDEWRELGILK
jgi:carbonic anhydrase